MYIHTLPEKKEEWEQLQKRQRNGGWNRKGHRFNLDVLSSRCLLKIQVDMKRIQLTIKAWSVARGLNA